MVGSTRSILPAYLSFLLAVLSVGCSASPVTSADQGPADQLEKTIDACSKAIRLNPKSAKSFGNRGYAYNQLGQHEKAIDDLSKAISLAPKKAWCYGERGFAFHSLGRNRKAILDYNKALSIDPKFVWVLCERGCLYSDMGQLQKSINDFNSAISLAPNIMDIHSRRANAYFDLGQYQKAIKDYSQEIRLDPKNGQAYANRSAAFRHAGHGQNARDDWKKAVTLDPSLAAGKLGAYSNENDNEIDRCKKYFLFANPGAALTKLQDLDNSALDSWSNFDKQVISEALNKIQRKAPGLVAHACSGQNIMLVILRHANSDNGRIAMQTVASCIELYPTALRLPPVELEWLLTHELAHAADTNSYLSDGDEWDQMVAPYLRRFRTRFSQFNPSSSVVPSMAAIGLPTGYAASKPSEALAEYTAAMVLTNWSPPESIKLFIENKLLRSSITIDAEVALQKQAQKASAQNDWNKAIVVNTQLLKLNPQDSEAYDRRANAYYQTNQFKSAIDDFCKSIAISPNVAETYCGRGFVYNDSHQTEKAIFDFKKAISINQQTPLAYLGLGFVHDRIAHYQKAVEDYSTAVKLVPKDGEYYCYRAAAYEKIGKNVLAAKDRATARKLGYNAIQSISVK